MVLACHLQPKTEINRTMLKKKSLEKNIREALAKVTHPRQKKTLVELGLVQDLTVSDGKVTFILELAAGDKDIAPIIEKKCQDVLKAIKGVEAVNIILTAERQQKTGPGPHETPIPDQKVPVPGVEAVIAVSSGKGGVGKSTVAVNLALAFGHLGLKVGLLDADIYGPSLPKLMSLDGKPDLVNEKIVPIEKFGMKIISMGLMVEQEAPLIWRGPMVGSAVRQFLYDVDWSGLDVLVVDMPPGTGDAQLTLAQRVPLAGAVIVSTPQDLALIDARKGLAMFQTIDIPILGIIENMSTFICPHCGEESHIFSHGGARLTAEKLDVPFLGEIPLNMTIRETSDAGKPLLADKPKSLEAKAFMNIAEKIKKDLFN